MNLLKKGIFTLLISILIISCLEDDFVKTSSNGSEGGVGLSEITFPSHAITVKIEEGDGTIVNVRPQGLGATSYCVDFGDPDSTSDVIIITEDAGTATYDYPNTVAEGTYTITVTAKAEGLADVVQTKTVTLEHSVTTVASAPDSPTILDENVYAVFSDGTESGVYTNIISGSDFNSGSAQYTLESVDGNNIIQYSRLQEANTASITFDPTIVIADVFGAGASADYIHLDLHSIHEIGVNKVKITLGGKTFEQTLENDVWTSVDIDFASEGITQIDEIKLELGASGTASNEATLNVDNIYLYREPLSIPEFTFDDVASDFDVTFTDASELATSHSWDFGDGNSSTMASPTHSYVNDGVEKTYMVTLTTTNSLNKPTSITKEVTVGGPTGPFNPEIAWGSLDGGTSDVYPSWKISTTGNSNPFNGSGDGSCTDYDGNFTGSKDRGAKWGSTQSAEDIDGTVDDGDTRYMYQLVEGLTPNTDYIFEYEYAIRTGGAATNSVVAAILNGGFSDSDAALASIPLVEHIGSIAEGKFSDSSCSFGTTVQLQFRSNSIGEVSIFIYAFTDKDAYVDNVKMYPL